MKAISGSTLQLMKTRVLFGVLATVLSFYSVSDVFAADIEVTSSEAAPEDYQENWWRSVRKGMWEWEGADWADVNRALGSIESATGVRHA